MGRVVMVDEKFCFEEETHLTVHKTSVFYRGDGFVVYDTKGEVMMRFDSYYGPDSQPKDEMILMDATGKCLLTLIRKKLFETPLISVHETDDKRKWGKITFLTPGAAQKAAKLDGVDFAGSPLKVLPSRTPFGGDHKMFSFPAVKAKVYWPRRPSKGCGVVKCNLLDVGSIIDDLCTLVIGEKLIRCHVCTRSADDVMIHGIDKELSEAEIWDALQTATNRKIHDFRLFRGDAVENPSCGACEEALQREISHFMPKRSPHTNCYWVKVFQPEPNDYSMKALITFDGRLHLEAARALEQLEGKVLPG